jgi:hypothetical protein
MRRWHMFNSEVIIYKARGLITNMRWFIIMALLLGCSAEIVDEVVVKNYSETLPAEMPISTVEIEIEDDAIEQATIALTNVTFLHEFSLLDEQEPFNIGETHDIIISIFGWKTYVEAEEIVVDITVDVTTPFGSQQLYAEYNREYVLSYGVEDVVVKIIDVIGDGKKALVSFSVIAHSEMAIFPGEG